MRPTQKGGVSPLLTSQLAGRRSRHSNSPLASRFLPLPSLTRRSPLDSPLPSGLAAPRSPSPLPSGFTPPRCPPTFHKTKRNTKSPRPAAPHTIGVPPTPLPPNFQK